MSLTIAPSPFGSLVVSVAETGSTLSVTTVATSPSVLTMALGVPGPAGSQGPAGTNGTNGVGVPVAGTTGQALVKLSGTNYDTGWASINSAAWGNITGTLSSQTDLYNALNGKLSLSGGTMSGTIFLPSLRNLLNTNLTVTAYNDTGAGTNFIHTFDAFDGTFALATNGGGLKFPDETVQVTAYNPAVLDGYLPLTGGTVTGSTSFTDPENTTIEISPSDGWVKVTNLSGGYTALGNGAIDIADSNGYIELSATGIKFPDSSVQSTAFPPTGGTTSQYIRGDGSVATYGPLGDRYLTSSTSTLTCDSGNGKTMTVGTGLSYSRQQDITVSYSNAIHMHGTVLTYDSATGVMTFDSNTHSGGGTYSSWEVNVGGVAGAILPVGGTANQVLAKINSTNFNTEWVSLGSASTQPSSAFLQTANNLSDVTASTARTNLGLGTASTLASTAVAQTANNLSDLASASSARTNLGLGAVSTDAYATTAQAQAGTSTTTVISPATLLDGKYFSGGKFLTGITWSTATSGTGASSGANGINVRVATAPTTAIGYAQNYGAVLNNTRGGAYNAGIDWSKRVAFGGRINRNTVTPDSNSAFRFTLGRFAAQVPSDILSTDKQVGIKVSGSGAIVLMCANGSALSTVTSTFTPSNASAYDVVIVSDGAGNVTLYVNGTSVATSTGGPTSAQGTNYATLSFETQNSSILTNGNMVAFISDAFAQVNL